MNLLGSEPPALSATQQEREERFYATFELAPVGMAHVSLNGKWLLVNQKLCEILGYAREELLQRCAFLNLASPNDLEPNRGQEERFLSKAVHSPYVETRYIRKDSSLVYVRVTNTLVHDTEKTPRYFLCVIEDIEMQRRAEERDAQLAAIVQSSDDAILSKTLDGIIANWNAAAERMYGCRAEEAIGQSISLIVPPERVQELQDILRKVGNGEHVKHLETVRVRKDGVRLDVSVTISPVKDSRGNIIGASAVARDIGERKRTETLLRQAIAEKEVLLKEVHHRVKNNLQIIASLLNLQESLLKEPRLFNAFQDSRLRIRAMALIHEKLYQSSDIEKVDFAEYARSLVTSLFRVHYPIQARIAFELQVEPFFFRLDLAIPCGLILNELVTNVLKHAFPDGREGVLQVGLSQESQGRVQLQVHDNGVGGPARIDFRQTESLGLQLVVALVEQIHGEVEVRGGNGTSFLITFPLPEQ